MTPRVRFYWEEPLDPELIRQAAVAAYGMEDDKARWDGLWHWRIAANPLAEKISASYIVENETVACFYAVSPLTILTQDNAVTIKAGLAVWGFTHPDFQGRGYYSELYLKTQESLAELGYSCLLAFDNHNSHYPEVKYLGWRDIGLLTSFSLDCSRLKPIKTFPQDMTSQDVALSVELLDKLSGSCTNHARFHIQRSFAYLKWRLLDNPVNAYQARVLYQGEELVSALVYKRYSATELDIMEVFYREMEETERFSCAHLLISDLASQPGIRQMNIWSQLQSSEHLYLEKIGFTERCFSTYFVCNPMRMGQEILDIRNWHYRFLDSDVY